MYFISESMNMSSSDDSDSDGLRRVSSLKKNEERFEEVPDNKKYKFEIVTGDIRDKFKYKLKANTALPHTTILQG